MSQAHLAKVQKETETWRAEVEKVAPAFLNVGENERLVVRGGRTAYADMRRKYAQMQANQAKGKHGFNSFVERWDGDETYRQNLQTAST